MLDYWQQPVAYDDLRKLLRIGHALQVHLYNPAFSDVSCTIPIDEFTLSWLEMDEFYALIQPG